MGFNVLFCNYKVCVWEDRVAILGWIDQIWGARLYIVQVESFSSSATSSLHSSLKSRGFASMSVYRGRVLS